MAHLSPILAALWCGAGAASEAADLTADVFQGVCHCLSVV
jgi:hypothetical protein